MNKHNFFWLKNDSLGYQVLIGLLLVLFGLSAWFWVQGASGFGEVSDLPDLADCAPNVKVPFCPIHVVAEDFSGADDVYAADIDRDGDLDLVGAGFGAGQITWWQNTGDGSSWQPKPINNEDNPIGGPDAVVAADLDRDGDLDIVASAFTGDQISWFQNHDNGSSWTPHVVGTNLNGPKSVIIADINGDGHLDIVAAAISDDLIAWWENDGTPTDANWTKHEVSGFFDGATSVIAADIDRDGDLDIVGAGSAADDIAWWENQNGDGITWEGPHTVEGQFANVTSVIATDVDQDGDLDIVGTASGAKQIRWWQNGNGQGTNWNAQTVDNNFAGTNVIASDVDQDGDMDLLAASASANQIALWENQGNGSSWLKQIVDDAFTGAHSVYSADIDQDGDLDLLGAAYDADKIAWWENQSMHRNAVYPDTARQAVSVPQNVTQVSRVYSADIDKDGDQDILAAASDADQIIWWRNKGGDGANWGVPQTIAQNFDGAQDLYPADLDRDGDLDLVAAAANGNKISWWPNSDGNGTTWGTEEAIESNFNGAAAVIAADLNGDGKLDILGAAANEGISWWQNMAADGTTWSSKKPIDSTFNGATDLYVADVDRDGDQDILAASETNNQIAWWENKIKDNEPWQRRALFGTFNGASAVYAADIDHDGHIDVLGAAKDGQIAWWKNDGTPRDGDWAKNTLPKGVNGAHDVYAADMDADGDLDIVAAAHAANGNPGGEIRWWENAGNGSSWTPHSIDQNFNGASTVIATDMDRDGDLDLLAGGGNQIAWWPNQGGHFALQSTNPVTGTLYAGTTEDLLKVEVEHNGRDGDPSAQLKTLDLRFEDQDGNPLTTEQANALIQSLQIYRNSDNFDTFDSNHDTEVTSLNELALSSGQQTVDLSNKPALDFASGTPLPLFAVVELQRNAHRQTPNSFCLTAPNGTANYSDLQQLALTPAPADKTASCVSIIRLPNVYLPMMRLDPTPTPTPTATFTPSPTPTATPTATPTEIPCLTQEMQPNDTSAEALDNHRLCPGTSIQGTLSEAHDRHDIYWIEPETAGTIVIELTNIPAGTNYDLYFYRSVDPIKSSTNGGQANERIQHGPISAGRYFISVRVANDGRSSQSYRLTWRLK